MSKNKMKVVLVALCLIIYIRQNKADSCMERSQFEQQIGCANYNKSVISFKWLKEKINWTQTEQIGVIDVSEPNLINCPVGNYRITLRINESVTFNKCNTNYTNEIREKFSEIEYLKYEVDYCKSCKKCNNNKVATVIFNYVFSGCYILEIADKNEQLYVSLPTFISTNYTKQLLVFKEVVKSVQPQCRKNKLEITITMNSTYFVKPPSIYAFLVDKSCTKTGCMELEGAIKIDYLNNDLKALNQTFICCNTIPNITWTCEYSGDFENKILYTCMYIGLNSGNYSFRYGLLDEYTRCNENTIWIKGSNGCEAFIDRFQVDVPKLRSDNQTDYEKKDLQNNMYSMVIIVIPLAAVFICIIVCTDINCYTSQSGKRITFQELQASNINTENLPLCNQEILIIYARDSEPFTAMMENFKNLLTSTGNITVYDINSDGKNMCPDPQTWIITKIADVNTKIFLFLNHCGFEIYEKQSNVEYKDRKWQDQLFLYAVKQLKMTTSRDYTNLFVAELASTVYETIIFDDLNPAARYVLPNNIETLLQAILPNMQYYDNLTITEFSDSCHICNEFYKCNPNYTDDILEINI